MLDRRFLAIRWHMRSDMPSTLEIENDSFEYPWSEQQFIRCLQQRNCIALAAEYERRVVGYVVYELHRTRLHILNLAVAPAHWRHGVGAALVQKLMSKLSAKRRSRIVCEVADFNTRAHLFFRAMGFRATGVMRDFYEDIEADAYLFEYRYPGCVEADGQGVGESEARNR